MKDQEKELLFKKIYSDFADPIFRTCCSYLIDDSDRKDLFQEILSNIWKGLDKLRNPQVLKTWTYRVSHNTAMSFLIKKRKLQLVDKEPSESQLQILDDTDASIPNVDKKIELMFICINLLATQDKAIISMVLEDLSTKEISDVTGLSSGNVRVKIHRIKKSLRSLMEEHNGV